MEFIIASIVNFAIVLFILWKYLLPPLKDYVARRSGGLQKSVDEAKLEYDEAKINFEKWDSHWKDSKKHAGEHFEDMKQAFNKQKESAIAEAQAQSKRILSEGKLLAQGETDRAKRELQYEIAVLSLQTAADYLEKDLGTKEKERLMGEYLEQVKA